MLRVAGELIGGDAVIQRSNLSVDTSTHTHTADYSTSIGQQTNIEHQTNVGKQTNIGQQVTIGQQTCVYNVGVRGPIAEDDAADLLRSAKESYFRKDYSAAEKSAQKAACLTTANGEASLYYCLAKLAGRTLSQLPPREVDGIARTLLELIEDNTGDLATLSRLVLALIRYDYYRPKGLRYEGISTEALLESVSEHCPTDTEKKILHHLSISSSAATRLNLV